MQAMPQMSWYWESSGKSLFLYMSLVQVSLWYCSRRDKSHNCAEDAKQRVQGVGIPRGDLPQFPDSDANHYSIRTFRCLAANLARITLGMERRNGGVIESSVVGKLEAINDILVVTIEEMAP